MKLEGDKEMQARFRNLARQFPDRAARALFEEMEIEATECKKLTPVDTGALRATEHATPPERHGRRITVSIVAGGPSAPYAVKVHEDLEAWHDTGQAKFIEQPLMESAPFLLGRVARRISLRDMT